MIVYYDPDNSGQVMAVYSHESNSTVWSDRGYERADVPDEYEDDISRDTRVGVTDGTVTDVTESPNPVQPETPAEKQADQLRERIEDRLVERELQQMRNDGRVNVDSNAAEALESHLS